MCHDNNKIVFINCYIIFIFIYFFLFLLLFLFKSKQYTCKLTGNKKDFENQEAKSILCKQLRKKIGF